MAVAIRNPRAGVRKSGKGGLAPAVPDKLRDATVSRWGNSLGLRISREAAHRLKLKAGARVSVECGDDCLTIRPVGRRRKWTEAELLKGVTPEAVGGEVNWGGPVGKEVW